MTAIHDFETLVAREAATVLESMPSEQWETLEDRVGLLLNARAQLREREYGDRREDFVRRLFLEFTEISESWNRLHEISRYVARFPYGDTGISKTAHLCYHVENYLSEVYILRNRLEAYLKALNRLYKLDPRSERVRQITGVLNDLLPATFDRTIGIRGKHVHRQRYTDADLEKLRTLELLKDDSPYWENKYEAVYREIRRVKRLWIDRTNRYIERRLETYFSYLAQLLFSLDGQMILPERLRESA